MSNEFTLCVGDNEYEISGTEAAWYAFQCACTFAEAVGGEDVSLWSIDEARKAVLIETN